MSLWKKIEVLIAQVTTQPALFKVDRKVFRFVFKNLIDLA